MKYMAADSQRFSLEKDFTQPASLYNVTSRNEFCPCGNSLYVIISTIPKDYGIKVLPTRAGGEKDKNFLQVNIFSYLIFN